MLDKGPASGKAAILQILYCFTHFVDITQCPSQTLNSDLFRIVAKYVEVRTVTILILLHMQDNYSTVGGDGGCRVSEVRAGTTSLMPDHKGFKLQ